MKYEGIITKYLATLIETGEDEEFPSKSEYDLFKKTTKNTKILEKKIQNLNILR